MSHIVTAVYRRPCMLNMHCLLARILKSCGVVQYWHLKLCPSFSTPRTHARNFRVFTGRPTFHGSNAEGIQPTSQTSRSYPPLMHLYETDSRNKMIFTMQHCHSFSNFLCQSFWIEVPFLIIIMQHYCKLLDPIFSLLSCYVLRFVL